MRRMHRVAIGLTLCFGLLGGLPPAGAQENEALGFERTPPRLSFTDGQISFWRAGASEWTPAVVNTPMAPGDQLYTAAGSNLELQVGPRTYVRAGENTQLALTNLEPDFLQLGVTTGHLSLDLRSRTASQTIEIDTPNAAFTIERTGYYRVEVDGETTSFITRRGGRASVTPAQGTSAAIEPSEQVVVTGSESPTLESYAAPALDAWDRWNYARTDEQLEAVSARYVSPNVYGVSDLDHYGDWRLVPTYGTVWVPRGVAAGWVPYSTGRWIYDPFYGWTWVDNAPWGWAPFHYGRWVFVSGFWAWCPGPVVVRPYYSPALVAFFGGGGVRVGITIGTPYVGWVALGWGEPVVPWWGPATFRGRPWWGGWRGPRVVNRVVVKQTVVVQARDLHAYANAHDHHAIVSEPRDRFGRRSDGKTHFTRGDVANFEPWKGQLSVKPDRSSLVAERGRAARPPREDVDRRLVATRAPRAERAPGLEAAPGPRAERSAPQEPAPARVVEPERKGRHIVAPERPPFGRKGQAERQISPPPPRFEQQRRQAAAPAPPAVERPSRGEAPSPTRVGGGQERGTQERGRQARPAPQAPAPPVAGGAAPAPPGRASREAGRQARPAAPAAPRSAPQAPATRSEAAPAQRELPGESANRVWRPRSGGGSKGSQQGGAHRSQAPRERGGSHGQGRDQGS